MRNACTIALGLLLALCLTGCANPFLRQLNRGALVPVYIGSRTTLREEMVRRGGTPPVFPKVQEGWTDRERLECAIAWSPDPDPLAHILGTWTNEFCHLIELCGGDYWKAAYLVSGGNLNALCDDMPAEAKAAAMALTEARHRAKAEGLAP